MQKDDPYDEQITRAVELLFRNKICLPLYPFKQLIFSLQNGEILSFAPQAYSDYVSIPEEQAVVMIKLAVFGESECVGAKQLSKLINSRTMKTLKDTAECMKTAFGSQPSTIKTERIVADFVEVYSVESFLGQQIAQPRQHRVNTTLEIIVGGTGTFEECLTIVIRRILDDAHRSTQSLLIVSSTLSTHCEGSSPQMIDIHTMVAKRQQVLTTLKAAIVNDGDIILEFFLFVDKTFLAFHSESTPYRETTCGCIHVTRKYKLSYRNERGQVRCFSRYPQESVSLGVFLSLTDAQKYLAVYREQLRRVGDSTSGSTPKTASKNDVDDVDSATASALSDTLDRLCVQTITWLNQGELANGAETMILLHSLLSDNRKDVTYCMNQLRSLTNSIMGHIRAVRDAIQSVRMCTDMILSNISHSTAVANQVRGLALTTEEVESLTILTALYSRLSLAVIQIKGLVLELLRTQLHSTVQYASRYISNIMWLLFNKTNTTQSILHIDAAAVNNRSLADSLGVLSQVSSVLTRLDDTLKMLEVSIGSEILSHIFRQDLLSYAQYDKHTKRHKRSRDRSESDIPRCVLDLIGFCFARQTFMNNPNTSVNLSSTASKQGAATMFAWKPLALSSGLKAQLIRPDERTTVSTAEDDRLSLDIYPENAVTEVKYLWELFAIVGEYSFARHGGIDFASAVLDEETRYDVPKFMAVEGAKIRYLQETLVIQALHEACFFSSTLPVKRPRYPEVCTSLFKYPSYFQLWNGVADETIDEYVFHPVRKNSIYSTSLRSDRMVCGAYKIGLRNLPSRLKNIIGGGVFGSDRVLSVLGQRVEVISLMMWNMPPMFSSPPSSSTVGITMRVYCGLAVETATSWCTPEIARLKALSAVQSAAKTKTTDGHDHETDGFAGQNTKNKVNKRSVFKSVLGKQAASDSVTYIPPSEEINDVDLAAERAAKSAARREPDPDIAQIKCSEPIVLEVVVHVSHETEESLAKGQGMFASEVTRCLRYLMHTSELWNVERLVVHREPLLTCEIGTKDEQYSKIFTNSELTEDDQFQVFNSAEKLIQKFGTAEVDCSVCLSEQESRLSTSDLIRLLEKLVVSSDTTDNAILRESAGKSKVSGKPTDHHVHSDEVLTSRTADTVHPFGWHSDARMDGDVEDIAESDYKIDPTHSDIDRICADSLLSQLIQKRLVKSVRCFVQCKIRFTLIARLSARPSWKQLGQHAVRPAYSRIIGQQINPLTVGSDHDVARLTVSTLWFSPEASKFIWNIVREGETHCIVHETKERWAAYNQCMHTGDICRAYQHAMVSALLSQNYQLVAPLYRAFNGLSFKLSKAVCCVSVCRHILSTVVSNKIDTVALGLTLARHVCLTYRYLFMSPQSIHCRGGCAYILLCISKLETVLHLSSIGMDAALGNLPSQLGEYVVTEEETGKDSYIIPITYVTEPLKLPPKIAPSNSVPSSSSSSTVPRAPPVNAVPSSLVMPNVDVTILTNSQLDRNTAVTASSVNVGNATNLPASNLDSKNAKQKKGKNSSNGESHFRKALTSPQNVREACVLLLAIENSSKLLVSMLSKDLHTNFLEVEDALKECPRMQTGQEVMDLVLGENCDLSALLAFIQRGASLTNKQLEDPEFVTNLESLGGVNSTHSLHSAVMSSEAADIFRQISDLNENASKHEKHALTQIVKSAMKQSASKDSLHSVVLSAKSLSNSNSRVSLDSKEVDHTVDSTSSKPPQLAKSAKLITSLLSGLKSGSNTPLVTSSDPHEKLQISTDDFRSIMEGGGGGSGVNSRTSLHTGDDSMQFTPDRSMSASKSWERLNPVIGPGDNKGNKSNKLLRDALTKLTAAKMFSVFESADEDRESPRVPVVRGHKVVLSRFHEEEEAERRAALEKEQLLSEAILVDDSGGSHQLIRPSQAPTISTSGFRLVGDSVREAAESRSMLQLLRVYSGAHPHANMRESGAIIDANDGDHAVLVNRSSVLQSLRNLPSSQN